MSDKMLSCSACNQMTPRNMHNKCIYCGAPYPETHWISDYEKAQKIARLKLENEVARQKLEESREKEKERKRKQRDPPILILVGDFHRMIIQSRTYPCFTT